MCTNLMLKSNDNNIILSARTMDFGIRFETKIRKVGRLQDWEDSKLPPIEKNPYGYIKTIIPVFPKTNIGITVDGINEKGLSAASLWLPHTSFPKHDPNKKHDIPFYLLIGYILGRCIDVQDVINKVKAVNIVGEGDLDPVHFIFTDIKGESIVIEFEAHETKMYRVENGILTNAPFYHRQLDNLTSYTGLSFNNKKPEFGGIEVNGSGLLGLPGDYTPKSRFVKATQFAKINFAPKEQQDAVTQMAQIIGNFYVPYGAILKHDNNKVADYTQWSVIREHRGYDEINYYFQTKENPTLFKIALDKLDWDKHEDFSIDFKQATWCIDKTP